MSSNLDSNLIGIKKDPNLKRTPKYLPMDNAFRESLTDSHSFSGSDIKVYMRIPNFFYQPQNSSFASEDLLKVQAETALEQSAFRLTPEYQSFKDDVDQIKFDLQVILGSQNLLIQSAFTNSAFENSEIKDLIKKSATGVIPDSEYINRGLLVPLNGDQISMKLSISSVDGKNKELFDRQNDEDAKKAKAADNNFKRLSEINAGLSLNKNGLYLSFFQSFQTSKDSHVLPLSV